MLLRSSCLGLVLVVAAVGPAAAAPRGLVAQRSAAKPAKRAKKAAAAPATAPAPGPKEGEPPPPAPCPEPAPATAPVGEAAPSKPSGGAPETEATEPAPKISARAFVGYGSTPAGGLGFGAHGAYDVVPHVPVGLSLTYQLGRGGVSALFVGPDVGYAIAAGPLVVTPYLGLGVFHVMGGGSTTVGLWPGVLGTFAIPKTPAFVGVDARMIAAADGAGTVLVAYATGGARF